MMITDALANASDARQVYALLGAYFEAVQCYDLGLTIPASLTRLPVRGEQDISCRYADARILGLRSMGETGRRDALVSEIADVCAAALNRLAATAPLETAT